jgi:hypothetical protein
MYDPGEQEYFSEDFPATTTNQIQQKFYDTSIPKSFDKFATDLNTNSSKPSNKQLLKYSLKVLTSSVDKDLNRPLPANLIHSGSLSSKLNTTVDLDKPILKNTASYESLDVDEAELINDKGPRLNHTSTALNSKASSMFNLNNLNDINNNASLGLDEPGVVFNKTFTSWPMEDQQLQLQKAFEKNAGKMNVTQDIEMDVDGQELVICFFFILFLKERTESK